MMGQGEMLIIWLMVIPLVSGLVAFFTRGDRVRRVLILACAGGHLALTCLAFFRKDEFVLGGWFVLDSLGFIFLAVTSLLFFGASIYAVKYLSNEQLLKKEEDEGRSFFSVEAVFSGCFLLFLSSMTVVVLSHHFGVLWVAIEATTLVSAPLIYFHRTKRSLEATWKYLLICSVGIALALLGIFFLAAANAKNSGDLVLGTMISHAVFMDTPWLKAAFLLLFIGYGTKMGLAPCHTWLPDAHSEAPSVVSALLSGALLNCAFLGILRAYQVCAAAGLGSYCREVFILFGLLSILFAAFFILGQTDYKRMLAYSSVEHMGILTFGMGLGGGAVFGVVIGLIGHSLTKAALFFTAGGILSCYKTKTIADVRGLIAGKTRVLGVLWLAGFLLITGTPPSGVFLGKFIILKEALFQGHYGVTAFFLIALAIVFIGMARVFISMAQGLPASRVDDEASRYNTFWSIGPCVLFLILVMAMGLYFPAWLSRLAESAANELGGF